MQPKAQLLWLQLADPAVLRVGDQLNEGREVNPLGLEVQVVKQVRILMF